MAILDALKRFLKGSDPKALMDIEANTDINSAKTNTSGTGQTGKIKNKGTVQIDNSTNNYFNITISQNEKATEELKELIKASFEQGQVQFLSQSSDGDIMEYNKYEKSSNETDIINFFQDKISSEDLQCIRTGLFIRQLSIKDKKRATKIKDKAATRGQRTRNIINMASAGYFETYIRPIFENNPPEKAQKEYEDIVRYLPELIFVNKTMRESDILSAVKEKITQKEKYHLRVERITINGLESCVDTIKKSEPKLIKEYPNYEIILNTKQSGKLKQAKLIINLSEQQE